MTVRPFCGLDADVASLYCAAFPFLFRFYLNDHKTHAGYPTHARTARHTTKPATFWDTEGVRFHV